MNPQDILEHFRLLSGLEPEEAEPWLRLCSRCALRIRRQLRDPALENDNSALLSSVAAEVAYARYVEISAAREAETFSAGDISIRCFGDGAVKAAKSVAKDAMDSISHLLVDQNFMFHKC